MIYDNYLKAKDEYDQAVKYADLLKKRDISGRPFHISVPHCVLKLVIHGQEREGGTNYHTAYTPLYSAILEVIAEDPSIMTRALDKLKQRSQALLIESKDEIAGIMSDIHKAETKTTEWTTNSEIIPVPEDILSYPPDIKRVEE